MPSATQVSPTRSSPTQRLTFIPGCDHLRQVVNPGGQSVPPRAQPHGRQILARRSFGPAAGSPAGVLTAASGRAGPQAGTARPRARRPCRRLRPRGRDDPDQLARHQDRVVAHGVQLVPQQALFAAGLDQVAGHHGDPQVADLAQLLSAQRQGVQPLAAVALQDVLRRQPGVDQGVVELRRRRGSGRSRPRGRRR